MLFLIIGGGIYLTIISRANPLLKISTGFKLLLKKDKSIADVVEVSDQLNLKSLSKFVTKYLIKSVNNALSHSV